MKRSLFVFLFCFISYNFSLALGQSEFGLFQQAQMLYICGDDRSSMNNFESRSGPFKFHIRNNFHSKANNELKLSEYKFEVDFYKDNSYLVRNGKKIDDVFPPANYTGRTNNSYNTKNIEGKEKLKRFLCERIVELLDSSVYGMTVATKSRFSTLSRYLTIQDQLLKAGNANNHIINYQNKVNAVFYETLKGAFSSPKSHIYNVQIFYYVSKLEQKY